MLLFAAALAALFTTGALTQRFTSHEAVAETSADLAAAQPTARSVTTGAVSFPPQSQLQALWSTSLTQRFPLVLPLAIHLERITDNKQIVSYYGNPYSATMGILGEYDLETIGAKLQAQAAQYDAVNGPLGVIPAMHLVYAVAQYYPTDNGLYLQYLPDEDVQRYVTYTREHRMLLFLDLQIGRSSVPVEVEKVLPYLRYPNVHLAIDPEFAVSDPEVPGTDLGSLSGADIDAAQQQLEDLIDEEGLSPKILIVHQFADSMVHDGGAIKDYPNVERIFDMDGYGAAAIKRAEYQDIASRPYAPYMGIKLFFRHDPDLMSAEDVLRLQPAPTLVIYQ